MRKTAFFLLILGGILAVAIGLLSSMTWIMVNSIPLSDRDTLDLILTFTGPLYIAAGVIVSILLRKYTKSFLYILIGAFLMAFLVISIALGLTDIFSISLCFAISLLIIVGGIIYGLKTSSN
ncbi:MAG: hypothetical protein R2876_01850 [Eubacteriales bacterium]